MTNNPYPDDFHAQLRAHTLVAARRILAALPAGLNRRRIAEIGCGTGTFLAAALETGSSFAYGVEGAWVQPDMLDDPAIEFRNADLEQDLSAPRVDLVLSLDVAQRLSPGRAVGFVRDLVAMAPAVLFSAAIPGQGDSGHINEQWQSIWAELFSTHGYLAHDVVRPAIWTDEAVPAWFRQNTVLYLDPATTQALALTPTEPALLDRVHPGGRSRANRQRQFANALPESEVLRRQAEQAQQ